VIGCSHSSYRRAGKHAVDAPARVLRLFVDTRWRHEKIGVSSPKKQHVWYYADWTAPFGAKLVRSLEVHRRK
jgi:hypothetical protein